MANQVTKRTRLSPKARLEQLVGIAVELLLSRPLDDLTVEAVATEAGVSRALIFHYFPTVRELRLAALEVAADALVDHLVNAVESSDSAVEDRLRAGIDAFIGFVELQPQTFDALSTMAAADDEFGSVFRRVRQQAAVLVSDNRGIEPDPLTDTLIVGWVAFIETVVRDWVSDPSQIERHDLLNALIDSAESLIGRMDPDPAPT